MNKKIRIKETFILLSLLTMSIPALSSTLSCPRLLDNGTYTGRFTDVINRDGWDSTTYIFSPSNGAPGCVQFSGNQNSIRHNIIMNAFLLNRTVSLSVGGLHTITGIGYSIDK